MAAIDALELFNRINSGESLNLLDVREVIEFHTYNIGGKNMPLPTLTANINQLAHNKTDEIIVICKVGLRSETACAILSQNGFERARNLTGGLLALQRVNHKHH
jgi:rhodanese-related sulfurtransferase